MTIPARETITRYGFVIEHPQSSASSPRYLSANGNTLTLKFGWERITHALRFARREDAEYVARISRTFQPELWLETKSIGEPRIAEHAWEDSQ